MKGHPILGAVFGFLFGLSTAGFLLTIGVLATDSILHVVLPLLFLVVGIVLAAVAPFGRARLQERTTSPAATPEGPPPAGEV
jgi:hypothetical protein